MTDDRRKRGRYRRGATLAASIVFASACAHTVSADGLGASQREALNACLVEAGIVRPMNTCSEESIWDQLSRLEQLRCSQDNECWVTFELSAPDRWG